MVLLREIHHMMGSDKHMVLIGDPILTNFYLNEIITYGTNDYEH